MVNIDMLNFVAWVQTLTLDRRSCCFLSPFNPIETSSFEVIRADP